MHLHPPTIVQTAMTLTILPFSSTAHATLDSPLRLLHIDTTCRQVRSLSTVGGMLVILIRRSRKHTTSMPYIQLRLSCRTVIICTEEKSCIWRMRREHQVCVRDVVWVRWSGNLSSFPRPKGGTILPALRPQGSSHSILAAFVVKQCPPSCRVHLFPNELVPIRLPRRPSTASPQPSAHSFPTSKHASLAHILQTKLFINVQVSDSAYNI
jgi:hypothetical protein